MREPPVAQIAESENTHQAMETERRYFYFMNRKERRTNIHIVSTMGCHGPNCMTWFVKNYSEWKDSVNAAWSSLDAVRDYLSESGKTRMASFYTLSQLTDYCSSATELVELLAQKGDMGFDDQKRLSDECLAMPLRRLQALADDEQNIQRPLIRWETDLNGHKIIEGDPVGLFGEQEFWRENMATELYVVTLRGEVGMLFVLPLDLHLIQAQIGQDKDVLEAIKDVAKRLAQTEMLPKGCTVTLSERESGTGYNLGYDMGFFFPESICCEAPKFSMNLNKLYDDINAMFSRNH